MFQKRGTVDTISMGYQGADVKNCRKFYWTRVSYGLWFWDSDKLVKPWPGSARTPRSLLLGAPGEQIGEQSVGIFFEYFQHI